MYIVDISGWTYYAGNQRGIDREKVGKWMFFFHNREFVSEICKRAVETNVVVTAKHTNADSGVACFYLNCDDMDGHRKVIQFFLDNGLIRKTKTGKFFNISFKLDRQTDAGEYGKNYKSNIKHSFSHYKDGSSATSN